MKEEKKRMILYINTYDELIHTMKRRKKIDGKKS